MKRLFLHTVLCFCLIQTVFAQYELERANDYFSKTHYASAIPLYEKALPYNKSMDLIKNLADSYYHTFNMKAAAKLYGHLISRHGNQIDRTYYFRCNQALKAIGNHEEADRVLTDHYLGTNDSAKLKELQRSIAYLENVSAIGERFTIENLPLNTPFSEFGAMAVDTVLIYTAAQKEKRNTQKLFLWNNENYLNLYEHPLSALHLSDSISRPLSKNINSKLHEGTFAVSKDEKTLYFTRNNTYKGKRRSDSKKISNLKIYRAQKSEGQWKNIEALPFNDDDFSTVHPTLSTDGKYLYFASDRPGGHGSFDLYRVIINTDGSFGNPENLGPTINTDKKEQFPFMDRSGNLYFASNGHPGYGLLDVFITKAKNGDFLKPDNVGLPVNSGYDDFSFWVQVDGKHGYFASNRPGGKGSDDIYTFIETKPLVIEDCKQYIVGTLTDRTTGDPLANASVSLFDANGTIVKTFTTDAEAIFDIAVGCDQTYRIEARKEAYEDNAKTVVTDKERNGTKDGSLDLYSLREKERLAKLALQKKKQDEAKRLRKEKELQRQLEKEAVAKRLRDKELADKKAKEEKAKKITEAIKSENALVKDAERTYIKTEEIHFDYSLWYLRREARKRLGKVIEIMKRHPGMVIEIGTHTDIRGNSSYNKELSQKRADAVKAFLITNGIEANRVVAKGYGESKPIVTCASEAACTEEDHEWNRRCEFVVVKWN